MTPPLLTLGYQTNGRAGNVTITAKVGDVVLAVDAFDVRKPKARDDFAKRLCDGRDGIGRAAVDAELLRIAASIADKPKPPESAISEIEQSSVVRPELFHMPEVSGITVPILAACGAQVQARWYSYLRWVDGRRERQEFEPVIKLPDGSRLWIYPTPSEPSPTMRPGWSARSRAAWLAAEFQTPNPADVFKLVCERIAYYLEFPQETAAGATATLALWTMFTYIFPAWRSVPYLNIGGPLNSGKSTVFKVLAKMVYRPLISSNLTAPCLFRTLHDQGGTLLLDEAERLREGSPDAGELRSVLLAGYQHGTPAMRLEKTGETFRRVTFDVFGPKALAGIAQLPEALASRCIKLTMFRAGPDSPKPRRRIDDDEATWQVIRDDLHVLALEHGAEWSGLARRAEVAPTTLAARNFELWQPLLAIAEWIDGTGARGLLTMIQGHALTASAEGAEDGTPDADEVLLRILAEEVASDAHHSLKAGDILRVAQGADAATFGKWSAKGVGSALKRYGLRTTKRHGGVGRTYHLVTLDSIRRIESSYSLELLPPDNVPHVKQGGLLAS